MLEKLQSLGIDTRGRTSGKLQTICFSCSHERKKSKEKCMSVDLDTGHYHCAHCGKDGWAENKKSEQIMEKKDKDYKIPNINNTPLSDKALAWFTDVRKISKSTVLRWGITQSSTWMPQVEKEVSCINFNYFRNEQIVNIKFRDGAKNFRMSGGAELIFYGLDFIKDEPEALITEGEIDALSFYESGYTKAISVPNGASKGNQKLEYLDNCYQHFEDKKKVYIATDSDDPGLALREELARRIGKEKCWIVVFPEDCKDANEVLVKYGKEAVLSCIKNSKQYPIEGINEVKDIEGDIDYLFENGYPEGLPIQFAEFDKHLTWAVGEVTTVTGIPGSGKTYFMDEVLTRLARFHDWSTAIYSPETRSHAIHFTRLASKYIGKPFYTKIPGLQMSKQELKTAKDFVGDHFFFIKLTPENVVLEGLLEKCRELVVRKGIKMLIIDAWNKLEHKLPSGMNETLYISAEMDKLSNFAKMFDIHIILVAHPTKIPKDKDTGKYRVATLYDISGSANFFNKTDNGLSVYRDFQTNQVDVHIQKVKNDYNGSLGVASFAYHKLTGRYREIDNIDTNVSNAFADQEEMERKQRGAAVQDRNWSKMSNVTSSEFTFDPDEEEAPF